MFSTFFTNFQAMNGVLFNPSAPFFFSAWPVLVSVQQECECQMVSREDIKREWAACKMDGYGSGEYQGEHLAS